MDNKITRRVVLGSIIGALAVGPFLIRAFRKSKQLPLGEESQLALFRKRFEPRVSFPRVYDGKPNPKLPADKAEKVLAIHRRYWENYSRLDEVEFDYSSRTIIDGKNEPNVWSMDAHVRMKYGYGMDAKGTDSEGNPIHLFFNLDGEIAPVGREESDLSSLMLSFFYAFCAHPEMVAVYVDLDEGVNLPQNPYVKGHGLYDAVRIMTDYEPGTTTFANDKFGYFSQETGMLELETRHNKKDQKINYQVLEYGLASGIMIPTRNDAYFNEGKGRITERYKNVKAKLFS